MSSVATFDFRISHERYTSAQLVHLLPRVAKKWAFQGEHAPSTGYHHWQGRLSLHKRLTVGVAKRLILDAINCQYIKPTSAACVRHGAMFYVQKDDTYDGGGRFTDKDVPREPVYIPRQYRHDPLPWQQVVLDSAKSFDDRTINVIVDEVGGIGKSVLAGLARARGFVTIPCCGDHERLIYTVCQILRARGQRQPGLVILDLPRAVDKKRLASFMIVIEEIKNGFVYDTRHSYKSWDFDSPQVWVMSNQPVPRHYLSNDRWKMWRVVDNALCDMDAPCVFVDSRGETVDLSGPYALYAT